MSARRGDGRWMAAHFDVECPSVDDGAVDGGAIAGVEVDPEVLLALVAAPLPVSI